MELLENAHQSRELGLVGAARYEKSVNLIEIVRRALHTMVSEDLALHSASRIVAVVPEPVSRGAAIEVRLGEHSYAIELVTGKFGRGPPDVVAFAVGNMDNQRPEFEDFLISLLDGFGWQIVDRDGRMTFNRRSESGVEWLHVVPASSRVELERLFLEARPRESVLITNQTIPRLMREESKRRKVVLIHYSEFERRLRDGWLAERHPSRWV